jgi:phage shock protein C
MEQPEFGPPPARHLARSTTDRMWAGVCGGLAAYLDIDSTVMRICWAALTILTHGLGIPAYILLAILMPRDDRPAWHGRAPAEAVASRAAVSDEPYAPEPADWPPHLDHEHFTSRQRSIGLILVVIGGLFLASNLGWFNWINLDLRVTWPLVIVAVGIALLAGQGRHWRH